MPTASGPNPEYHLTLSDVPAGGSTTVGLILQSLANLRRLPRGSGVERKNIRQQTWVGGRGAELFSRDTTRFADSGALWSMVPFQLTNGPLMRWSTGYRDTLKLWPGDVVSHGVIHSGFQFVTLTGSAQRIP